MERWLFLYYNCHYSDYTHCLFIKEAKHNLLMQIAISLLFAGALGNFIDRVLNGEVVDFVDTYIFSYNFPIFNVADSSLTIGVVLVIIALLRI